MQQNSHANHKDGQYPKVPRLPIVYIIIEKAKVTS